MANICAKCKKQREERYMNMNPSNKYRFLKFMVGDFMNTLDIPRKFTDEFQMKLSERVTLRCPSGNTWTTKLAQSKKGFVLQNGWRYFVKDHGINKGDSLMFQYVEKSMFDVLMFDDSGFEKEGSHFVEKDGKFYAESCCSWHQAKKRNHGKETIHDIKYEVEEDEMSDGVEIMEDRAGSNSKTEKQMKYLMYYESNRRVITEKDRKRVFDKASKFRTQNPSCMIRLKPSHVHHLFLLTVPKEFADHCLPKTSQKIMLRNNGITWKVNLNYRRNGQCTLNGGWAQFVLDNNLEVEDICILELVDTGKSQRFTLLDTHIFRAVEKTIPLKVVKASKS